ncbi:hypothetical protein BGZ63DRAFT_474313 [Mariannaea sp. PMI_226]|nr:hypothetical protein BGZ63DRAFT_474313 [Mariannaea sp. PMI_226]
MVQPVENRHNGATAQGTSLKKQLNASRLRFVEASVLRPVPGSGSAELWAQNVATDHMVTCRWTVDGGWEDPVIKPFGDLTISPLASCIHYATQCFEGMKVYRGFDNRVRLFRPDRNANRLAMSAKRVSLPDVDAEQLVELIKSLVRIDAARWLPEPGSFRYIRPALIGTGCQLGVQVPKEATLLIAMVCWPDFSTDSPPGVEARSDLRLLTSRNDTIRAWPGGFGYVKVGANYGPSFRSHCEAQEAGYDQILWLFGDDGQVTEAGASNFFAIVKNELTSKLQLLTAPLTDKLILDGVTRRSVLELVESRLARELEVRETKFTISDLEAAWKQGCLLEAFVSGTAFFIKEVSTIRVGDLLIGIASGILGQYYSARHTLEQYRSACVIAAYSVPWGKWSLQATIRQHPGLLYGVSDEAKAGIPLFRQMYQIDRRDVLEVIDSRYIDSTNGELSEATPDAVLSRIIGERHAELWPINKPAWKVIVLEHIHACKDRESNHVALVRFDIAFLAHHAIADGLSGISFHRSLMEHFQDISRELSPPPWPMVFDEIRATPAPVEDCVDCLSCTCAICSSSNSCDEQVWSGAVISPVPAVGFKSMVRMVTIPTERLSDVLQKCKRSNITLTGLLHALICTSLYRGIKDVPGFRVVTPFSVRRHTKASDRDIVNHISFLTSYVPRTELSKIEKCEPGSATEEQHIIQLARSVGSDMAIKVNQFPHGGMATQLSHVQDFMSLCESQGGKKRSCTYELSNLGSASNISTPNSSNLKLEKLAFTQCGMVAGPAIGFNCASIRECQTNMGTKMESEIVTEWIILIPDIEGSYETRMMIIDGSAIIARAKTEAEILDVLKTDIYVRKGVWDLDKARIIPRGKTFALEEITMPPLKEHQVYVKVEYAAFNPTDRLALDVNAFGDGAVLGCDFAGTIVEAHPNVTKFQIGDNIAGFIWGGEIKGLGAYSMYTIADERLSFKIPHNTSPAQASSVPLAASTSWLALFSGDCLALSRDNFAKKPSLLIWGGSSVVGYFAIQLAKLYNIEVATTCSPRNFEQARQAGATHVFDYNDEDVTPKIKAALPNLAHVFDTIGNATSSATAAEAISNSEGVLCTVRPGKANTQDVPSHIKVTDVFVFTVFPTAHSYRGKAHWPVKMADHNLGSEFHAKLESLLGDGSLKPPAVRIIGTLSPSTVEEAMKLNRQGRISGEKLIFERLLDVAHE